MSLVDAWERIDQTPERYRMWIDRTQTLSVLRCKPDELDALEEAGLATQDGQFERYDVWNTGFAEGRLRSRGEREMVFFNRLLKSHDSDWTSPFEYDIHAVAVCADGDACPGGSWKNPQVPGVSRAEQRLEPGRASWTGRITLRGADATVLSPVVNQAWQSFMADYRFCFASRAQARDADLTRRRRSGDCKALSIVLADMLRDAGYEATVEYGYIFGGFRTRWHQWVRFRDDDGRIKYLDISMAMLADRFFTPEYQEFCRGGRLNRVIPVTDERDFFIEHECGGTTQSVYVEIALKAL